MHGIDFRPPFQLKETEQKKGAKWYYFLFKKEKRSLQTAKNIPVLLFCAFAIEMLWNCKWERERWPIR